MYSYFITATGTGIGKTFVTCTLAWHLKAMGKKVTALKPIISGWEYQENTPNPHNDTVNILRSLSLAVTPETIQTTSPWRLEAPLSPDMAAMRENRVISFTEVLEFCNQPTTCDYRLIEGAGGIMTPLTCRHTMRDLIAALQIPAILVTGTYLGSLSHCLTAIESLHAKKIPIAALIVSESADSTVSLAETLESLRRFCSLALIPLPRTEGEEGWKFTPDVLQSVPH